MTVVTVGVVLVVALVLVCGVVLYRRRGSSGAVDSSVRSAAQLDAEARSSSPRGSDRQGTGPF